MTRSHPSQSHCQIAELTRLFPGEEHTVMGYLPEGLPERGHRFELRLLGAGHDEAQRRFLTSVVLGTSPSERGAYFTTSSGSFYRLCWLDLPPAEPEPPRSLSPVDTTLVEKLPPLP